MADQRDRNKGGDVGAQQRQRSEPMPHEKERTQARERPMDDPTRGRQGDMLEEELPHGRSRQEDRESSR